MATGLNDFLKHIKSNPQNDVLVDRFTSLVMELDAKARQPYFEKLFNLLETSNPHGALRVAYFNLQAARAAGTGSSLEIEALQWIERAFIKLGKSENASLVKEELARLKKKQVQPQPQPPPLPDRRRRKNNGERRAAPTTPKPAALSAPSPAEQRFTTQRADFIASLYESFARQLLDALIEELGQYKGRPQTEAAASHIIRTFQQVYARMKATLRNAVAVFGHNPLLIDEKDRFRDELIQIFLKSPLFTRNRDRIASQRARLVASLMTAWFDQQQHMPEGILSPEQERLQNKLLEIAVTAVLRFDD
ncbi:hypothetical protein [Oligoflexus tunisiensis]|uniref:hypothetical protein n=1 Tax=Oligoflexus tunisiensis TaxID=708132 RepID=UPI00114C91E6|nr:hypothetical protein [Oligoflexus tunisiensis]